MHDWDDNIKIEEQTFSFFINGMKNFWSLLGDQRRNIIIGFFWLIITRILMLIFPYLLKLIFDEIPLLLKTQKINMYIVGLVILILIFKLINSYIWAFMVQKYYLKSITILENEWPKIAQEKLLILSLGYHEKENTGKKVAKINKGVEKLVNILSNLFWHLMPTLFYLVLNIIFVLIIDWRLGLVFLIPFIPAVFIQTIIFKKVSEEWDKWEEWKEKSIGYFVQSILNIITVQTYCQIKREKEQFGNVRDKMCVLDYEVTMYMEKYFFTANMLLNSCFVLTIIVGFYFLFIGETTIGTLIFIISTGNVSFNSIWELVKTYSHIMKDLIAVNRMKTLLNEKPSIVSSPQAIKPKDFSGEIAFHNVLFRYDGIEENILKKLNLTFLPNMVHAFVGESGGGKSTIVKLLNRMYDVNEGSIKLDGNDIRSIEIDWLRKKFAVVTQDIDIFDTTVRQNIAYAYPDASDCQIQEALHAAYLTDTVDKIFPKGLETEVGERGIKLSGGQKQRVGIARAYLALLNGARILIMDEATSSLDSQAELAIQTMINSLREKKNITQFVIAHRLPTVKKADMIYVVNNGEIVETGDHNRLVKRNGLYAHLAKLQKMGDIIK